jgi:hypothetical protein
VVAGDAWKATLEPSHAPDRFRGVRRYSLLAAACALSTLLNPYGWRLHQHMATYLTSDWIRQVVDEFQSPRFRSESMLQFEILLFAGLALGPALFAQRRFAEVLVLLFWAHSSLISARHVPLYAIVAAPLCAVEASRLWSVWSAGFDRKSAGGTLRDCLRDFSTTPQRSSVWVPALLVSLAGIPWEGPQDFPANKFPVRAFDANAATIASADGRHSRVLTSDQWGDYLIYHLYPNQLVFVDGRSDFYGPLIGREYLDLLSAAPNWENIAEQYHFDFALLPREWPLAQLMMRDARWQVGYLDRQAILLERKGSARLNQKPHSTERIHREQAE